MNPSVPVDEISPADFSTFEPHFARLEAAQRRIIRPLALRCRPDTAPMGGM